MAILTNKPASVSADSTTSLTLNKADLQAKLTALNAGAYWQDQSTWRGVAFLFENTNKQKVTASFDASGSTANLNVSEFFVDGDIECKRIDVIGFASDYYTIYRSDFTSASEFDIEITDGYSPSLTNQYFTWNYPVQGQDINTYQIEQDGGVSGGPSGGLILSDISNPISYSSDFEYTFILTKAGLVEDFKIGIALYENPNFISDVVSFTFQQNFFRLSINNQRSTFNSQYPELINGDNTLKLKKEANVIKIFVNDVQWTNIVTEATFPNVAFIDSIPVQNRSPATSGFVPFVMTNQIGAGVLKSAYMSGYSSGNESTTPTVLVDVPALISGITTGQSASGNDISFISNTIVEQGITYRYKYLISPSNLFTLPSGINNITTVTVPFELENRSSWTPINTVKIVAEIYELISYTGGNSTFLGLMVPTNGALPIATSEIPITELNTSDREDETFTFNTNLDANKRYGISFSVKVPQTDYPALNSQNELVLVRIYCADAYGFRNSIPLLTNYAQKNNSNQIIIITKNNSYNWTYSQAFYNNFLPILKVMGTSI